MKQLIRLIFIIATTTQAAQIDVRADGSIPTLAGAQRETRNTRSTMYPLLRGSLLTRIKLGNLCSLNSQTCHQPLLTKKEGADAFLEGRGGHAQITTLFHHNK